MVILTITICRRSDYIIGFITPAIGPNKSKKLTRFIAPVHNIRGKVWMKKITYMASQTDSYRLWNHVWGFSFKLAVYIVCRRYKPCEFPGFVWTNCWGNKSDYVITSPANYYQITFMAYAPSGHRKIFAVLEHNQDVNIFCEIKHLRGLLRSPERMGPEDKPLPGVQGQNLLKLPGLSHI